MTSDWRAKADENRAKFAAARAKVGKVTGTREVLVAEIRSYLDKGCSMSLYNPKWKTMDEYLANCPLSDLESAVEDFRVLDLVD